MHSNNVVGTVQDRACLLAPATQHGVMRFKLDPADTVQNAVVAGGSTTSSSKGKCCRVRDSQKPSRDLDYRPFANLTVRASLDEYQGRATMTKASGLVRGGSRGVRMS